MKVMYVYIMANGRPTLYVGVTNNLIRRVNEHKQELIEGFTKKYHLHKLIYHEIVDGQLQSIIREKQIKDMNRSDKLAMIKRLNPLFKDLYKELINDSGQALRLHSGQFKGSELYRTVLRLDSGPIVDHERSRMARMTMGVQYA